MKTLFNRTVRALAVTVFFVSMLAPQAAMAHETTETAAATTTQAATTAASTDAYQFTAKKGDSLTRMARRALQLFQSEKKITLAPEAAVYGETVIAQALGGSYLEIGQHVSIPKSLLQSTVDGSKTLTSAQLSRWAKYAANVSFEVSDIQVDQASTSKTETEQSEKTDTNTTTPDSNQTNDNQKDTKKTDDKKNVGTYWWFIGAGALIAIYFVLGGQTPRSRQ